LAVTVAGLIGLWLGLLGGVVWASRTQASGRLSADYGLSFHWPSDAIIGVVAGLGTQVILIPAMYLPFELADSTLRRRLEAPAKTDTAAIHGGWQIAVLFMVLAVGAPVVEELFFRGLLQGSLARRFGPVVAMGGSAVAFGLAHFQLLQLPALVAFGLILAFLAHRSGRLGPGIMAHVAFNAFTVLTLTVAK
jgi:membrane protease YdiL (CAAX protease family)